MSSGELNTQKSKKQGFLGFLETVLRQFQNFGFILIIAPIAILCVFCIGVASTPGFYLFLRVEELVKNAPPPVHALADAMSVGAGLFFFVVVLPLIVPLCNLPFKPFVKPYRGPWFSLESVPWVYHNALTYLVRYTVLDFVTPSPLNVLFYRMMGMKIGKGAMINTSNISDPCLIELGDYVTIGGSAFLMAHYGMHGFLIIDTLKIRSKANIGLHAYLMGPVEVGEGAQILPNTAVLPKTRVPAGAKFGPASAKEETEPE